jgi:nitrogen fixation protein FixH
MTDKTDKKKMTGFKFGMWLFGFFGTIFTVNFIMMTFAFSSHPGQVSENPYRDAKAYNKQYEAAQEQKKSGWKINITHLPTTVKGDQFSAKVTYPASALPPLFVKVTFKRPALTGYDLNVVLFHQGDHIYSAPTEFKMDGVWNILVTVETTDKVKYYAESRLVIEHAHKS